MFGVQILSDVHLDVHKKKNVIDESLFAPSSQAQTLALLGDVCAIDDSRFEEVLKDARRRFERVIFVPGNHEYYTKTQLCKRDLDARLSTLKDCKITVLNRDTLDIGNGVRVLGCTLWSHVIDADDPLQRTFVESRVNDYFRILVGDERRIATVNDTNTWHKRDVLWLERALSDAEADDGVKSVVVMTHHAPLIQGTSDPKYEARTGNRRVLNQVFRTDLSEIFKRYQNLISTWCFGHTHYPADFLFHGVRVVSHPIGYPGELSSRREPTIVSCIEK